MKIRRLCIANGDEYEEVSTDLDITGLKLAMLEGDVIPVRAGDKKIFINTEFIVSLELGESRKLSVI